MSAHAEDVLRIFTSVGGLVLDSHIVYTSGRHGATYVNKDAVYPHTAEISRLCRWIAEHFAKVEVNTVLAPALGGIILSQWVAHHLSELRGHEVHGVYAEKDDTSSTGFVIKRGYDQFIRNKKVLVVEDILNTGGSLAKVISTGTALGAQWVGAAALCNRGNVTAEALGKIPELFTLLNSPFESWEAKDCPLCAQHVPINTQLGKGKEFLAKRS